MFYKCVCALVTSLKMLALLCLECSSFGFLYPKCSRMLGKSIFSEGPIGGVNLPQKISGKTDIPIYSFEYFHS